MIVTRLHEIHWSRWTCPAYLENVQRWSLSTLDNLASVAKIQRSNVNTPDIAEYKRLCFMSYSNSQNVQHEHKMSGVDPNVHWTNCPAWPKKISCSLLWQMCSYPFIYQESECLALKRNSEISMWFLEPDCLVIKSCTNLKSTFTICHHDLLLMIFYSIINTCMSHNDVCAQVSNVQCTL